MIERAVDVLELPRVVAEGSKLVQLSTETCRRPWCFNIALITELHLYTNIQLKPRHGSIVREICESNG